MLRYIIGAFIITSYFSFDFRVFFSPKPVVLPFRLPLVRGRIWQKIQEVFRYIRQWFLLSWVSNSNWQEAIPDSPRLTPLPDNVRRRR
jgi:hypothetical protein